MKEKLIAKLDEHVERLMEKPELTSDEYMILKERLREIRFSEEEAARKTEWEQKMHELTKCVFSLPAGGGMNV